MALVIYYSNSASPNLYVLLVVANVRIFAEIVKKCCEISIVIIVLFGGWYS